MFSADKICISLQVLFNSSIAELLILGLIRPYEALNKNSLEICNEVMLMILQYHLICFADLAYEAETRS